MPDKIRTYLPSAVLAVLCIIGMFLPDFGIGHDEPWYHALLFHFSHANVFHLAANLWVLYELKPRWSTALVSYAIASLVALVPLTWTSMPTVGLSALEFAVVARIYVTYRTKIWPLLAINLAIGLLPVINGRIHIMAFLAAYPLWILISSRKKT